MSSFKETCRYTDHIIALQIFEGYCQAFGIPTALVDSQYRHAKYITYKHPSNAEAGIQAVTLHDAEGNIFRHGEKWFPSAN